MSLSISFSHSARAEFIEAAAWYESERGTEGIASEPRRHLARKLQLPLDRLKARLLAQGVQERVGLQILQARVPQPQRRLEPFERLRQIAPLRIDRGVLVRRSIALCCL